VKARRPDVGNYWGDAGGWIASAQRAGFPTGRTPTVGAIAVYPPFVNGAGGSGHVAIIEGVSGGRIYVADSNWVAPLTIGHHWSSSAGLSFIYFRGQNPGPPAPPSFTASLDAQFPANAQGNAYVIAGAAPVPGGWNIRFNQPFNASSFVMQPATPVADARFTGGNGAIHGTVAANDDHVGFFRTPLYAPVATPAGTYFMQWNVVDTATGQISGLLPSLNLVVSSPAFTASLDAQSPADNSGQVYVDAGGPAVPLAYNVRYNQPFNPSSFVLRPVTQTTVSRFISIASDWAGTRTPTDDHVGFFRASVSAPSGTAPGTYFIQWNAINAATGTYGGLQPSFKLVVSAPPAPPGQPCPVPAPGGPYPLTSDPSFTASLDAQFPADAQGKVYLSPGGTVRVGYNVRFNQVFSAQYFVLRTDTPGTINYFSDHKGDWYGTQPANDNHVGFYRANVAVPSCTPTGQYQLKWNVINMATGKFGGLQPSFVLVVQ
jgi:methionine-rich copper-binding protein CopC